MPIDQHDDDEKPGAEELGKAARFDDFECPDCNAHNPVGDSIGDGDEVICCYCGQEFKAHVNDSGKLKLKEA